MNVREPEKREFWIVEDGEVEKVTCIFTNREPGEWWVKELEEFRHVTNLFSTEKEAKKSAKVKCKNKIILWNQRLKKLSK